MGHNLNFNESTGRYSFFSVKEKAWHNLGQVVTDYPTSSEAIQHAGLDYEVVKSPLFTSIETVQATRDLSTAEPVTVPNYFANVRSDNNTVLGVVGKDYHIVQNRDAFAFFDAIVGGESGILYETAGALGNESVRMLKRTTTSIIDRGVPYNPRPLTKIVGGILASTNSIKKKDTLQNHLKKQTGLRGIDMGCAVDYGAFFINHDGEEDVKITDYTERINNYYNNRKITHIEFSKANVSMVSFFFQLVRYLQQSIGTIAAIDLTEYSKAIDFELDEEL